MKLNEVNLLDTCIQLGLCHLKLKFNKIRTMSKRKTEYKCPNDGCSKIFKEEGINDVNFKRYVGTCKHRKEMCKKRSDITNYFKSANTQTLLDEAHAQLNEDASIHEPEIDSSSHVEISENTEVIHFDKGKQCQGFLVSFDSGSVLSLYPFHRHIDGNKSIQLSFRINLSHDKNNTSLIAHANDCDGNLSSDSNEVEGMCNKVCADFQYSPQMKKLIEIGDCESPHEKLKLGMLSHNQLQKRYREYSTT